MSESEGTNVRYFQWFRLEKVQDAIDSGLWRATGTGPLGHHGFWSESLEWVGPGLPPGAKE